MMLLLFYNKPSAVTLYTLLTEKNFQVLVYTLSYKHCSVTVIRKKAEQLTTFRGKY